MYDEKAQRPILDLFKTKLEYITQLKQTSSKNCKDSLKCLNYFIDTINESEITGKILNININYDDINKLFSVKLLFVITK